MPLLEVRDLRSGYGHTPVLHGVDLVVEEGETAVLLGLNGAGKTTTLATIAGLLKPWGGEIQFEGAPVTEEDTRDLVKRGLVLIPEGRRVFPGLTVENNLRLGAWPKRRESKRVRENTDRVFEIFPRLAERRGQLAGTLSGGEQQMLAVGRGLMPDPRLLLIDEASLGLAPKLALQVFETIQQINEQGVTVFMVEQNAGVLRMAQRAYIMEKGRIVYEGTGSDLMEEGQLRQAYLGAPA